MKHTNDDAARPPLRLVTDDLLDAGVSRNERENVAIAQRLANNPRLGITRVTVVGANGTHVIVPEPMPAVIDLRTSDSEASQERHGIADVRRYLPWKKQSK
jgi:hypothetical protein